MQPLLRNALRGKASDDKIYVPPSLDIVDRRKLSLDLGGGNCKWQPPTYQVPEEIDFHKAIIAGFPSGDKRMIFIQMEALTGWREFCFFSSWGRAFFRSIWSHVPSGDVLIVIYSTQHNSRQGRVGLRIRGHEQPPVH